MTNLSPKRPRWQRVVGNTIWVIILLVVLVSLLPKTKDQLAADTAAKAGADQVAAAKTETEGAETEAQLAASAATTAWRETAIAAIRQEPKVVEAIWPDGNGPSLWVSMRDDGSRRDGYAEYLCLTLGQHGMQAGDFIVIHVYDAAAMARQELREIGKFTCSSQ